MPREYTHSGFESLIKNLRILIDLKMDYILAHFEAEVSAQIKNTASVNQKLLDAIRYSLLSGGKRLRGSLVLLGIDQELGFLDNIPIFEDEKSPDILKQYIIDDFNTDNKVKENNITVLNVALSVAVALEMVHEYSLIHDDMPCMDNDDLRRGKPSCHNKFGESIALLAGNSAMLYAFKILSISHGAHMNHEVANKLMYNLSLVAGVDGIMSGQTIDIGLINEHNAKNTIDQDSLLELYKMKTGALFSYAFSAGAIMSQEEDTIIEDFALCGYGFGIAFQIYDDILDGDMLESSSGFFSMSDVFIKLEEIKSTLVNIDSQTKHFQNFLEYFKNKIGN